MRVSFHHLGAVILAAAVTTIAFVYGTKTAGGSDSWGYLSQADYWAEGRLPQEVLHRKKWGFRVPLAEWFRGSLRPLLHDSLTASNGLCGRFGDVAVVRRLLEAHQRSDVDASMELWTLLSAEVWFQNVFSPAVVGVGATTHEPRNVHVLPTNA